VYTRSAKAIGSVVVVVAVEVVVGADVVVVGAAVDVVVSWAVGVHAAVTTPTATTSTIRRSTGAA
jgi:hypothetical protein